MRNHDSEQFQERLRIVIPHLDISARTRAGPLHLSEWGAVLDHGFLSESWPGQMYLASPLTVAASALAGTIVAYDRKKIAK